MLKHHKQPVNASESLILGLFIKDAANEKKRKKIDAKLLSFDQYLYPK
jgi:hypothetical protein